MRFFLTVLLGLLFNSFPPDTRESIQEMIDRGLERAETQAVILAKNLQDKDAVLPRTWEDGQLKTTTYSGWVSGFFPGVLWMLYEETGRQDFRNYAEEFTARVEPARKLTNTHDLGFMLMSSFGQGYRITGDPHYLEAIHEGADSLLREVEVTMQWYSPLYRYPLAENVSTAYYRGQEQLSRSEQTYLCSPDEQEYSLGTLCVPDPLLKNDLLERSSLAGGTAGQASPLASRVTIEKDGGRVDVMIDGLGNGASEFTVMLCDVQGRVYQYQKGRASERISMDTGSLNAGYYFIEVSDGNEVTTRGFTNN